MSPATLLTSHVVRVLPPGPSKLTPSSDHRPSVKAQPSPPPASERSESRAAQERCKKNSEGRPAPLRTTQEAERVRENIKGLTEVEQVVSLFKKEVSMRPGVVARLGRLLDAATKHPGADIIFAKKEFQEAGQSFAPDAPTHMYFLHRAGVLHHCLADWARDTVDAEEDLEDVDAMTEEQITHMLARVDEVMDEFHGERSCLYGSTAQLVKVLRAEGKIGAVGDLDLVRLGVSHESIRALAQAAFAELVNYYFSGYSHSVPSVSPVHAELDAALDEFVEAPDAGKATAVFDLAVEVLCPHAWTCSSEQGDNAPAVYMAAIAALSGDELADLAADLLSFELEVLSRLSDTARDELHINQMMHDAASRWEALEAIRRDGFTIDASGEARAAPGDAPATAWLRRLCKQILTDPSAY